MDGALGALPALRLRKSALTESETRSKQGNVGVITYDILSAIRTSPLKRRSWLIQRQLVFCGHRCTERDFSS